MKTLETKDEFIKGIIAGSLGSLAFFIFVETIRLLGFIKYGQFRLAGDVVFNYQPSLFLEIIAFFMTIAFGAFWGVILAFIFSLVLNERYYKLKGAAYAFCLFILNLGFLDVVFQYPRDLHDKPLNVLVFLFGYLLYGTTSAVALKKLNIFE